MTRCVKSLVLVALVGGLSRADDLAARLEREFEKLHSDDVGVREAAVDAIAKEGAAARKAVEGRMAVEKDAEAKSRLRRSLLACLGGDPDAERPRAVGPLPLLGHGGHPT